MVNQTKWTCKKQLVPETDEWIDCQHANKIQVSTTP